ncbi:hypothetical protein BJV82DRAFT_557660 [Fennellomyces sp. T-0311]|nr:hypothetical protein BJV82DRAFT_557660 [Fennellomyces sp. T-0311]
MHFTISIAALLAATYSHSVHAQSQTSPFLAVSSPAWLANVKGPVDDAQKLVLREEDIKVRPLDEVHNLKLTDYPPPMKAPPIDDPEIKAVIDQIDWSKVPNAPVRKAVNGAVDMSSYDDAQDPHCWWSSTLCTKPKVDYLPQDISTCPRAGDWGLNYDDGPYRVWSEDKKEKQWEEPRLYNFLVEQDKQKATLFYIGSNVVTFPEAAQRAFSDGHTICSHTWSHPLMTTLTNEQIVSELYWTQKAIKQVIGITPKCWRPPFGDIDDRVRAIAWLMGMRTILWDRDTNDWGLLAHSVTAATVNDYFKQWIELRANNTDVTEGHIPLQHESSPQTIQLTEKWLPELRKTFNVMSIHQCLDDTSPYWEASWESKRVEQHDEELQQEESYQEESNREDPIIDSNHEDPSVPKQADNRFAMGTKDQHTSSTSGLGINLTLLVSTLALTMFT